MYLTEGEVRQPSPSPTQTGSQVSPHDDEKIRPFGNLFVQPFGIL
jgi:hypothetical protein